MQIRWININIPCRYSVCLGGSLAASELLELGFLLGAPINMAKILAFGTRQSVLQGWHRIGFLCQYVESFKIQDPLYLFGPKFGDLHRILFSKGNEKETKHFQGSAIFPNTRLVLTELALLLSQLV